MGFCGTASKAIADRGIPPVSNRNVVALLQQEASGSLSSEQVRTKIIAGAQNAAAPLNGITTCYSVDGDREGVLSAGALGQPRTGDN